MRTINALLCCLIATSQLAADSYGPFTDYRQVDPTGRYYLVIRFAGTNRDNGGFTCPVRFEFAERQQGSPPVLDASDEAVGKSYKANPDVCVRPGDKLLCKGEFDDCPGTFIISSTGLGFAGIDLSGHNYPLWTMKKDAVIIVSKEGVVRHRKKINDILEHGRGTTFETTAGGTWWSNGGWYDEKARTLILPSNTRGPGFSRITPFFCLIDLDTGKVEKTSDQEIIKTLQDGNRGAWNKSLELARDLKLRATQPWLPSIVKDKSVALRNRLQAAILLGMLGDKQGAAIVKEAVLTKSDLQQEAIEGLSEVLNAKETVTVISEYIRAFPNKSNIAAWHAMSGLPSQVTMPALLQLLDDKPTMATIGFACECLSEMGKDAKPAIPSLIRVLEEKVLPAPLINSHQFAALVLGKIGVDAQEALPILIRRAEEYSREEWLRVKDKRPELQHAINDWYRYSESYIIDAVWKIRKP